jgi:hypothetical protein
LQQTTSRELRQHSAAAGWPAGSGGTVAKGMYTQRTRPTQVSRVLQAWQGGEMLPSPVPSHPRS